MTLDPFLLRAAAAGIGVALAAAPLGCHVLWRRMAYFGDATAHAALLGVALALATALPVSLGVLVAALAMAATVSGLAGRGTGTDALLGVLAHGALAAGLVTVALLPGRRVDLDAYLFGDILTVTAGDLVLIWGGAALVLALLASRWSALLTATLGPDLAIAAGIEPRREQLVLNLALALTVAVALKAVGGLLITALLIMPAAAARPWSRGPEGMAGRATVAAVAAVLAGLGLALALDLPAGPAIVVSAAAIFALSQAAALLRPALQRRRTSGARGGASASGSASGSR